VRDLTGNDVDFVAAGQRHQHISVGDAGGFEHCRIGGVARYRADVESILQIAQDVLVVVDHRDFVGRLTRQVESRGPAYLAGPQYQYLHQRLRSVAAT
jgi:hypothetical protein